MVGYLGHFSRLRARPATLRPLVACGALAFAVFVVDVTTPLGPAVILAYVLVVVLAALLGSPLAIVYVAVTTSVLAMLAVIAATATGALEWTPIVERATAVATVWATAAVALLCSRSPRRAAEIAAAVESGAATGLCDEQQLVAALALANARVEAANRTKDEFLAVLSHELRNPLQTIAGWLDVLGRDAGADADLQARARAGMRRGLQAQTDLVNDLIDVSRIASGTIAVESFPLDLREPVGDAVGDARERADARGVRLSYRPPSRPLTVLGDRARLEQIVRNVLANALKFTPEGGTVSVVVRAARSRAALAVRDSGEGIAPEMLGRIFDRFWMADARRTRAHGGLGIGLAIAKHLVEAHGGTISAKSAGVASGTEVVITLPLVPAAANEAPLARPAPPSEEPLRGVRVLVVEDDDAGREALVEALRVHGADVFEAASVEEGLALYDARSPDIVLSDLGMPDRDGFDLARSIRARVATGRLRPPVLLALSGFTAKEDRDDSLAAGFDEHLAKPVSGSAIVTAVLRHMSPRRSS